MAADKMLKELEPSETVLLTRGNRHGSNLELVAIGGTGIASAPRLSARWPLLCCCCGVFGIPSLCAVAQLLAQRFSLLPLISCFCWSVSLFTQQVSQWANNAPRTGAADAREQVWGGQQSLQDHGRAAAVAGRREVEQNGFPALLLHNDTHAEGWKHRDCITSWAETDAACSSWLVCGGVCTSVRTGEQLP